MENQRNRLIELLEDTLHEWERDVQTETLSQIADHLLANGIIVPPCKVWQTVWWVTTVCDENCEDRLEILIGEVVSFSLQKEGLWAYCRYENGLTFWHFVADYFGKTVFLTEEEAEQALKGETV